MRDNSDDRTIERNYVQKWRFLVRDYERVKAKRHPPVPLRAGLLRLPRDNRQTFAKYYNRYRQSAADEALLPRKRGPSGRAAAPSPSSRRRCSSSGAKASTATEIYAILRPVLKSHTPAPSTIYAIAQRHGLNRLTKPMRESKRQIIKTRAGELGHLDCHYLSRDLIVGAKRRHYLVSVIDACTRLAWAEVVDDLKSLSVMFAALKSINLLNAEYGVRFEAILTDNGPRWASPGQQAATRWSGCSRSWASRTATRGPTGRRPTGRSNGSGGR